MGYAKNGSSTENSWSGSILILGMTQDLYFSPELELSVDLLCLCLAFCGKFDKKLHVDILNIVSGEII